MSKWRPSNLNCVYVIPDIHGAIHLLDQILARILPLRKSDGGQDKIIFLGDYIDRDVNSHLVVDRLIELKKQYGDNVICLMGNHELMLLEGLQIIESSFPDANYKMWYDNGGLKTIAGYLARFGSTEDPATYPKSRLRSIIPQEHFDFFKSLLPHYAHDDYIFVHAGGFNPSEPIHNDVHSLVWDRRLYQIVKTLVATKQPIPWEKVVVTGHNVDTGKPFINANFMMLDCGSPRKLLVVELNSLEAFMAISGKKRLVKTFLEETVIKQKKPVFSRTSST